MAYQRDDIQKAVKDHPVVQIRFRVHATKLDEFIARYERDFAPVDKAIGRKAIKLWHHTRSHFHFTFLFFYESFDQWMEVHGIGGRSPAYLAAWAQVKGGTAAKDPLASVLASEKELYELIEDDERLIFMEVEGNPKLVYE